MEQFSLLLEYSIFPIWMHEIDSELVFTMQRQEMRIDKQLVSDMNS